MMFALTNSEQYSEQWKEESEHLESNNIYEKLAKITPDGNVLELGCGTGKGTRHLANGRNILSLDGNGFLITMAKEYLDKNKISYDILKCDFFELGDDVKSKIREFSPKIVTGWFIGSHGEDIFKRTEEQRDYKNKPKLYREKIEDIIISRDICLDSVEYIHLVNRGGMILGFTDDFYFEEVKKDYDKYVFGKIGFEVFDVKNMEWPREGSNFEYGQAHNPNLAKGTSVPAITSIVAKRV